MCSCVDFGLSHFCLFPALLGRQETPFCLITEAPLRYNEMQPAVMWKPTARVGLDHVESFRLKGTGDRKNYPPMPESGAIASSSGLLFLTVELREAYGRGEGCRSELPPQKGRRTDDTDA